MKKRKKRQNRGHKKLPNRFSLLADLAYDPKTGELRKKKSGKVIGWTDDKGYRRFRYKKVTYCVHRVVYLMYHGIDPKDKVVDHCNGDTSDNRISNLRCVSHRTNLLNNAAARELEGIPTDLFVRVDAEEQFLKLLADGCPDF